MTFFGIKLYDPLVKQQFFIIIIKNSFTFRKMQARKKV